MWNDDDDFFVVVLCFDTPWAMGDILVGSQDCSRSADKVTTNVCAIGGQNDVAAPNHHSFRGKICIVFNIK